LPPPASTLPEANAGWRGSGCFERSLVRAETQRPLIIVMNMDHSRAVATPFDLLRALFKMH